MAFHLAKLAKMNHHKCGFAAILGVVLFEFSGVDFQFLIILSEELATLSLITARDNMLLLAAVFTQKNYKKKNTKK